MRLQRTGAEEAAPSMSTTNAHWNFPGDPLAGMVTGLLAVVTTLCFMVTHSPALGRRCGRRREHATSGAHWIFHGDPLAGMVTGLLAVVTTLCVMVTHSPALGRRCGRRREHATSGAVRT